MAVWGAAPGRALTWRRRRRLKIASEACETFRLLERYTRQPFTYHFNYFRCRAKEAHIDLHTIYRMKTDFHVRSGDVARNDLH